MPKSNQLDPARLAYIESLKRDGWRHATDFSVLNFCEVFLHRETDCAIKVSRLYNPLASGWRDFAKWTIEQQPEGELSPYLPRIWDLEIHERWYCARMERLQEIDALDDAERARIVGQIAEVRRRLHSFDFSISEGDDADLVDVLRRMVDRFKESHDWTPDRTTPQGWPRDRNFMIRPGETPQLVLNDPISEELPDIEERAAFTRRLLDDGWRLTGTSGVHSRVYSHADEDSVWKVSGDRFRRSVDGWIAYAEWVRKETAVGRGSPYFPRISDLTIASDDKWFFAKMERLREVSDLSDDAERSRIEAEIVEAQKPISARDFRENDSELVNVRRRLAAQFGGGCVFDLADHNFMVRPGAVPQLVITDPIDRLIAPPEPIDQLFDRLNAPPQPPAKSGLADLVELFVVGAAIVREMGRAGQK